MSVAKFVSKRLLGHPQGINKKLYREAISIQAENYMSSILSKRRKELKQKYYLRAVEKTDKAVSLLYSLGAAEVYIFGSLLHPEVFDEMSDVDIYVQGLTQEKRKGLFTSLEEIFGEITFDLLKVIDF